METLEQAFTRTYSRTWKASKSERTARIYGADILKHFGPTAPLQGITTSDIEDYIQDLLTAGNAPATINRKLAILSLILHQAMDRDTITKLPKVKRCKVSNGRLQWISEDTEQIILDYWTTVKPSPLMKLFTILGIDTGLRVSECLRLEKEHIDYDHGLIHIWENKSDKPRTIPCTYRVLQILPQWILLLRKEHPKPETILRRWKSMALALKLPSELTPHCTRHTFCSRLAQRGVQARLIQELAGHSSLVVTEKYMHLNPAHLRGAIGILESREGTTNEPV